jgi:signal transduction histidine kinase
MITSETTASMAWVETAYLLTDIYWRICFASDAAGLSFATNPGELEGHSLPELLGRDVFDELRVRLGSVVTLNGADYVISVRQMQVQGIFMRIVELHEAEASLTHVISAIIHELKNPLSAMQALVQSLEEDLKEDSNARQYTSRLVSEIERLGRLLSSMAHFSRLKYRPTKVFSLLNLVRYISDLFEQDFRRRNVNMQIISAQEDVQFRGDPDQMAQLFINLITNAIEAMPKGGVITVNLRAAMQDGTVGIKVADTGIGMSKETLERITKSPGRGVSRGVINHARTEIHHAPIHHARTEQPPRIGPGLESNEGEGMGLGLSIVHSIVRHHGGRMTISSNEGLGSEVTITFPAHVS